MQVRTLGYLLLGLGIVIVGKWSIPYIVNPSLFRPMTSYGVLAVVAVGLVVVTLVGHRIGRER